MVLVQRLAKGQDTENSKIILVTDAISKKTTKNYFKNFSEKVFKSNNYGSNDRVCTFCETKYIVIKFSNGGKFVVWLSQIRFVVFMNRFRRKNQKIILSMKV